jgi:hypothetical protein
MKEFSLAGFVAHLATLPLEIEHANQEVLDQARKVVEEEAKRITAGRGLLPRRSPRAPTRPCVFRRGVPAPIGTLTV